MSKNGRINRRDFLRIGTFASGGLLVAFSLPDKVTPAQPKPSREAALNAFLKIGTDNSIHIILSKVEMGQGIWTTLPMLIAEELDCDWSRIKVEQSPPGKASDFLENPVYKSTGGSETTIQEFDRYRMAGATARTMLVTAAAKRLGVQPQDCRTENSYVIAGDKRISYGEVATEAAKLPVPNVTLREPKDWKYIGKSQKRLDTPEKINGKATYGLDIHFPGLLTAVVAHPPVFYATVKTVDATQTKAINGVRDVVRIPTGVAVLADNFWTAKQGRDALQIEWNPGKNADLDSQALTDSYRKIAKTDGLTIRKKGDVTAALTKAERTLDADYSFPYLAHAPMEPLNCTVNIGTDSCEVWTGTQSPLLHQAEVARFLGLKPEQVKFYTPYLGGSFGRRGSFSSDWVMEAVHIAKTSGKAIKLVWTREDDIKGGYYRPVYVHNVRIAIGTNGFPTAWQHRIVGQSLFTNTPLADMIVHNGIDYSSVTTGAPYSNSVPDHSFELHTTTVNVPVLPWRSVGSTHSAFVIETLIDELAFLAKIDPVAYRRAFFINHPRHLAALNLAAEKSDWTNPLPKGQFRGIAVCEAMGSYVAQVVELSIDKQTIRVHRVVCAIDCGLAVNPDGVRAQMESSIVFGLTAALHGEITLKNGQVQQSNFHDYPMLRMTDTPVIDVHIVPSTAKMGGAGEPGVAPIAPALANALFAATGIRFRQLPIKLEELNKA
ncbi:MULTISPECIES: xanthine dehydrogenase family protein molybdopterin-binding subunit [unclassified Spirosoma]|uniref:xanthine dehydrogenase family protein molybdopterin-binding subunit n=1 Tax=unclassified Spirosoma TaxID=2621999 RepID=UPI0009695BFB|nr:MULTISPECIES: xanthine dehydrogenase family protein molybdopterin-binding subunit [unclassified Spirosoma]MBN8820951.1 xanthine dehydrogenase family protein molybdopterin-binding subunit [Spirosoma sp.]OJW75962.1 MAG: twin-arginine translocation pathway signal protein [Spirosoma sp. 48-14]